jgi:hypothetical protein
MTTTEINVNGFENEIKCDYLNDSNIQREVVLQSNIIGPELSVRSLNILILVSFLSNKTMKSSLSTLRLK